jgi:hypothetical protein
MALAGVGEISIYKHPTFVAIVAGTLLAMPYIALNRYLASKQSPTAANLILLEQGLRMYRFDFGEYPQQSLGLGVLVTNPATERPWPAAYITSAALLDEWNQPFAYALSEFGVELRSAGPDKEFATADDIVSQFE